MATESALSLLALLLIKPLLIILIIAAGLLLLRKTSAALQHFWITTGLFALVLLPVLYSALPEIKWEVLPFDQQNPVIFAWLYRFAAWFSEVDNIFVVTAIYFLGAFWLLFYLLLGILGTVVQTRQADVCEDPDIQHILRDLREEMDVPSDVSIVTSQSVRSPQMWGVFRPVIMLPNDASGWSRDRKFSVLLHELGHVARYDWPTTLVVKICCAVFWFLPPVWWLTTRLFHYAELACDDYVYRVHQNIQVRNKEIVYAENLLDMACSSNNKTPAQPVLMMAGHSSVFYRVEAILDRQRQRNNAPPEARQYWVLTLLMLLLPLASLQLMPIQQTLFAQASKIHVLEAADIATASPSSAIQMVPVHRMDAGILRKLKQQTQINQLPVMPRESVVITGNRNVIDDRDLADVQHLVTPVAVSVPLIQIRGYMPTDVVMPAYPRHALERGTEGEVVVEFSIAEDGSIFSPHILRSHPRHVFDKAVLAALKNSRYQPQVIDGAAVIVEGVTEIFTFQIEQPPIADKRRR